MSKTNTVGSVPLCNLVNRNSWANIVLYTLIFLLSSVIAVFAFLWWKEEYDQFDNRTAKSKQYLHNAIGAGLFGVSVIGAFFLVKWMYMEWKYKEKCVEFEKDFGQSIREIIKMVKQSTGGAGNNQITQPKLEQLVQNIINTASRTLKHQLNDEQFIQNLTNGLLNRIGPIVTEQLQRYLARRLSSM